MARTSKDKNETEHLRGELRDAQKVIKALKKRLRQLEKSKHIWTQHKLDEDENAEPIVIEEVVEKCPSCFTGTIIHTDLGLKNLHACSICEWRKVTPK